MRNQPTFPLISRSNPPPTTNNYFVCLGMTENKERENIVALDYADDETVYASKTAGKKDEDDDMAPTDEEEWSDEDSVRTNPPRAPATGTSTTRLTAWQARTQANNLKEPPMTEDIFNISELKQAVQWAILKSGATGYFLVEGAPAVNK